MYDDRDDQLDNSMNRSRVCLQKDSIDNRIDAHDDVDDDHCRDETVFVRSSSLRLNADMKSNLLDRMNENSMMMTMADSSVHRLDNHRNLSVDHRI